MYLGSCCFGLASVLVRSNRGVCWRFARQRLEDRITGSIVSSKLGPTHRAVSGWVFFLQVRESLKGPEFLLPQMALWAPPSSNPGQFVAGETLVPGGIHSQVNLQSQGLSTEDASAREWLNHCRRCGENHNQTGLIDRLRQSEMRGFPHLHGPFTHFLRRFDHLLRKCLLLFRSPQALLWAFLHGGCRRLF